MLAMCAPVLHLPGYSFLCCLRSSHACHVCSVLHLPGYSFLYCLRSSHACFAHSVLRLPGSSFLCCLRGSCIRFLQSFLRLQHIIRPWFTLRWKRKPTSTNRSPDMYTRATLRTYLSQPAMSTVCLHHGQLTVKFAGGGLTVGNITTCINTHAYVHR